MVRASSSLWSHTRIDRQPGGTEGRRGHAAGSPSKAARRFRSNPTTDLAVDDRDRRTRDAQTLEFGHRGQVLGNVSGLERNALLGEELLDPAAEDSAGLVEYRHRLGHRAGLLCAQIHSGPIRRHRAR
jgi:hypothetical protein